jgi:hypothetical protein
MENCVPRKMTGSVSFMARDHIQPEQELPPSLSFDDSDGSALFKM